MRLKRSRIKTYYCRKTESKKDGEGSTYTAYGEAVQFHGEIWQAGGKIQSEMYGERLSYIQNVRIQGKYGIMQDENGITHYLLEDGLDIVEGDGICVYASPDEKPDYKIISIKPYRFLKMEIEKIDHRR